jgi:hypothetical protein
MIGLLLAAASAIAVSDPGIRHVPRGQDWPNLLQTCDHRGKIVRLLYCEYRYQLAGTDLLPGLARNRVFMAILLAKDGAVDPWDLEPAWPTCKFLEVPK